jgi:hypothetical protein
MVQSTRLDSLTFLAAVDELAGVHAFSGYECLLVHLVSVGVSEHNPGMWGATTRVMHDVLKVACVTM